MRDCPSGDSPSLNGLGASPNKNPDWITASSASCGHRPVRYGNRKAVGSSSRPCGFRYGRTPSRASGRSLVLFRPIADATVQDAIRDRILDAYARCIQRLCSTKGRTGGPLGGRGRMCPRRQ
jgi:hypothetical protein